MNFRPGATAPAPPAAGRRPPGGSRTVADMLRSLGLLLAIVAVIVVVRGQPPGRAVVRTVDPSQAYAGAAHDARYPLLVPGGLPAGWRVTSARSTATGGTLTLHVGLLTPDGRYAALVESDRPWSDALAGVAANGPPGLGPVPVGGVTWQRWPASKPGDRLLVRQAAPASAVVTYAVTGNASQAELVTLAGSLQPYRATRPGGG